MATRFVDRELLRVQSGSGIVRADETERESVS